MKRIMIAAVLLYCSACLLGMEAAENAYDRYNNVNNEVIDGLLTGSITNGAGMSERSKTNIINYYMKNYQAPEYNKNEILLQKLGVGYKKTGLDKNDRQGLIFSMGAVIFLVVDGQEKPSYYQIYHYGMGVKPEGAWLVEIYRSSDRKRTVLLTQSSIRDGAYYSNVKTSTLGTDGLRTDDLCAECADTALTDIDKNGTKEFICYKTYDLGWRTAANDFNFPVIYEWKNNGLIDNTLAYRKFLKAHYTKVVKNEIKFFSGEDAAGKMTDTTHLDSVDELIRKMSPGMKVFWEKELRPIRIENSMKQ